MTNPELINENGEILPSGSLEIRRQRVLDRALIESVRLTNFALVPLTLTLNFEFDADFADIFELRGIGRQRRGHLLQPRIHSRGVTFGYRGLDRVTRSLRVKFHGKADEIGVVVSVDHLADSAKTSTSRATLSVAQSHHEWKETSTRALTSNDRFNAALDRSLTDMRVLWTERGPDLSYISAGVPWFDTLFGRDSALASMMSLALRPEMAREVIRCLTRFQGKEVDIPREEEPGKIVHEVRQSEMANTGEVVFGRYYGSIDSTPLFVLLAAEYYRWTADLELMRELQPALNAALVWIDRYGDMDGDGYLE